MSQIAPDCKHCRGSMCQQASPTRRWQRRKHTVRKMIGQIEFFNSRGLGKVVGLTDRYGRRTGILVRGIHLSHVADNLTEDDAYPRMDIGL